MTSALCETQLSNCPEIAYVREMALRVRNIQRGSSLVVARMLEVELAVDPRNTLPDVQLISASGSTGQASVDFAADKDFSLMHNGGEVGLARIAADEVAQERWFDNMIVNATGEGIGMGAYKTAVGESMLAGYSFRTRDTTISAGAKRIWEIFAAKGVAKVVEPFVPIEGGTFSGHYRIDFLR